jgi:hypothetical protein
VALVELIPEDPRAHQLLADIQSRLGGEQ